MELLDLLKNFGIPAVGAIAGWFWAAANFKHRLEQLERELQEFRKEHKELHAAEVREMREKVEGLRRQIEGEAREMRAALAEQCEKLAREVEEIDKAFTRFERASVHDFAKDAEFARFIEEQNKQWQAVHRLLGQIEGILKSQKRWSSHPPPMTSR